MAHPLSRGEFSPAARILMVLFLSALLGLSFCSSLYPEGRRYVLLYTDRWEQLFRFPPPAPAPARHPAVAGDFLDRPSFSENPFLLRTVDGRTAATTMTVEQLVAYWGTAVKAGYTGIAIDEFSDAGRLLKAKLTTALALTRWRYPHLYIAVWQAGRLDAALAQAYARYANLVVLEAYCANARGVSRLVGRNLAVARKAGIIHKTVVGLGINNLDPAVGRSIEPWANTPGQLEAQMQWVHRTMPVSPGIALFAVNASPSLQKTAYLLALETFSKDVAK